MDIDPKQINPQALFKAQLKDAPLDIGGDWPGSDKEGARTDIIIALLKAGLIKAGPRDHYHFDVLIPFRVYGMLFAPEGIDYPNARRGIELHRIFKASHIDWERITQEAGDHLDSLANGKPERHYDH